MRITAQNIYKRKNTHNCLHTSTYSLFTIAYHLLASAFLLLCGCADSEKTSKKSAEREVSTLPAAEKIAEVTVMELQPSVFNHEIVSNGRLSAKESVEVNFLHRGLYQRYS